MAEISEFGREKKNQQVSVTFLDSATHPVTILCTHNTSVSLVSRGPHSRQDHTGRPSQKLKRNHILSSSIYSDFYCSLTSLVIQCTNQDYKQYGVLGFFSKVTQNLKNSRQSTDFWGLQYSSQSSSTGLETSKLPDSNQLFCLAQHFIV